MPQIRQQQTEYMTLAALVSVVVSKYQSFFLAQCSAMVIKISHSSS